jgi:hypothetical protein
MLEARRDALEQDIEGLCVCVENASLDSPDEGWRNLASGEVVNPLNRREGAAAKIICHWPPKVRSTRPLFETGGVLSFVLRPSGTTQSAGLSSISYRARPDSMRSSLPCP